MIASTLAADKAAEAQKRRLDALRAILKPSPVRLGHVPGWLRSRILQRLERSWRHSSTRGQWVIHVAERQANAIGVLDHWGSTVVRGEPAFVSEPYPNYETIDKAKRFAQLLGLRLMVSANSEWYPGWTLRLIFTPPEPQR